MVCALALLWIALCPCSASANTIIISSESLKLSRNRFGQAEVTGDNAPQPAPEGFGPIGEPLLPRPLVRFGGAHNGSSLAGAEESAGKVAEGLPSVSLLQFGAGEGPGLSELAEDVLTESELNAQHDDHAFGFPTSALVQFGEGEGPGLPPIGTSILADRPSIALLQFGAGEGLGLPVEPADDVLAESELKVQHADHAFGFATSALVQFGEGGGPGLPPISTTSILADRPSIALLQFGVGEGFGLPEEPVQDVHADSELNTKHGDYAFGFPTSALVQFGEGGGPGLPPIGTSILTGRPSVALLQFGAGEEPSVPALAADSLTQGPSQTFGFPTSALVQFGEGGGPGLPAEGVAGTEVSHMQQDARNDHGRQASGVSFLSTKSLLSGPVVALQPFGNNVSPDSGKKFTLFPSSGASLDHISRRPLHTWWIALVLGLVLLVPIVAMCLASSGVTCGICRKRRRLTKRSAAAAAAPGMDPPLMRGASPNFPQPPSVTEIEP